jgi:phosphoribosylformimino-5-aminoimidazole carboxamide ribotide isomerase
MEIIPAIDILDGKCVRLKQGRYSTSKIYADNPVDVAKKYADAGMLRLHVVDLDGAQSSSVSNIDMLEKICSQTSLRVDFGGGIKSGADIYKVFNAGASYACIGSIAETDPETTYEWMKIFGGERIILGVDVWNEKVCINGWKKITGTSLFSMIERYQSCAYNVLCTDISRDGMMGGPPIELYKRVMKQYPGIKLIASGGVGSVDHLAKLALCGVNAAIVGKAIYENKIGLNELAAFMLKQNLKNT